MRFLVVLAAIGGAYWVFRKSETPPAQTSQIRLFGDGLISYQLAEALRQQSGRQVLAQPYPQRPADIMATHINVGVGDRPGAVVVALGADTEGTAEQVWAVARAAVLKTRERGGVPYLINPPASFDLRSGLTRLASELGVPLIDTAPVLGLSFHTLSAEENNKLAALIAGSVQ